MKTFKGKAIYNPSGKAGEYSYWACNFYVGCSNGCKYCYLKKGIIAKQLGGNKPQLKKCFKDEKHALELFKNELLLNVDELIKNGLFFSFTTDSMLYETIGLTIKAIDICVLNNIPVKILTKNAIFFNYDRNITCSNMLFFPFLIKEEYRKLISFGFTLTGHDELEPNASTNEERIEAMKKLHDAGFKTFASIEPIIDFESSLNMIQKTDGFCDLYKIGLESGKKYDKKEMQQFFEYLTFSGEAKIYWKESILKYLNINRNNLPNNCVKRDYSLWN